MSYPLTATEQVRVRVEHIRVHATALREAIEIHCDGTGREAAIAFIGMAQKNAVLAVSTRKGDR